MKLSASERIDPLPSVCEIHSIQAYRNPSFSSDMSDELLKCVMHIISNPLAWRPVHWKHIRLAIMLNYILVKIGPKIVFIWKTQKCMIHFKMPGCHDKLPGSGKMCLRPPWGSPTEAHLHKAWKPCSITAIPLRRDHRDIGHGAYITIGLWWDCSNETRFIGMVKMRFTDPRGGSNDMSINFSINLKFLTRNLRLVIQNVRAKKSFHEAWTFRSICLEWFVKIIVEHDFHHMKVRKVFPSATGLWIIESVVEQLLFLSEIRSAFLM